MAGQNTDEVTLQINKVRERERDLQKKNNELQHMLLDVEGKLEAMKDQTHSVADLVSSHSHYCIPNNNNCRYMYPPKWLWVNEGMRTA